MHFTYPQNRSVALDCLRGVAILGVVIYHVLTRYHPDDFDAVAQFIYRWGFFGVDLFFPLSGYLITRFLLTYEHADIVRTFFLRRIFRIFPLYFVAVAIFILASIATGNQRDLLPNIWAPLTFTTGWFAFFVGKEVTPFLITWTLSIEEFAYLLFGISISFGRRVFIYFIYFATIIPFIFRAALILLDFDYVYYLPPARLDSIAIGGLVALFMIRGYQFESYFLFLGIFIIIIIIIFPSVRGIFFLQIIGLLTCFFIAFAEKHRNAFNFTALYPIAYIGFHSYFIYLFHFFVLYGIFFIFDRLNISASYWEMSAFTILGTLIAAIVSYRVFEGPLLAVGRRFERTNPRKSEH